VGVADDSDPWADVPAPANTNVVPLRDEPPAWMDQDRETPPALVFRASPFKFRDPASIPRRQFLYGFELRRKQVSAMVAPGAAGKTTLKVGRAICMAAGRDFFGHRVWNGPHRVWLWNLEDEMEEVEKTVHAFLKLWELSPDDLGGRLFIDGIDSTAARELKLVIEDTHRNIVVQRPVSNALVAELIEREIDYLDVDPFVSSHSVDENSNTAIDKVAKEWVHIAHSANCAINLTHHIRKTTATETSAQDARGAGAMVNAARSVLVLQRMTKESAEELRISPCDRRKYFSVYDDKNNKAPAALQAEWYQFESIGLGNGDETGPEDSIGAVQRWYPPDTFAGVTKYQLFKIQEHISDLPDRARKHSKSTQWVGKLVAHVLDRNLDDPSEGIAIQRMIATWIANGALRTVERLDKRGETRDFVEVGQWANLD
jgi:hypothetical protein